MATDDLITVREAAVLVDRSVTTIRAWLREGALEKHTADEARSNAPVLVSRAELLSHAGQHAAVVPGRAAPPPPSPAVELDGLRRLVADQARDLAVAQARLDAAETVIAAERGRADAERQRAEEARADLERARAEQHALRSELEALRLVARLPWWRRLLALPGPVES